MSKKRRGELFRDPRQGKVAGICVGVADYFGWETWLVRIFAVSGVLLGMAWLIFIYIAAWFILDKKPVAHVSGFARDEEDTAERVTASKDDITNESIKVKSRIWQAGEPPKQAFHDIRRKFKTLEKQLRSIERYVTSPEFTVSREINKL